MGHNEVMTNPATVIGTFGQLSFRRTSEEKSIPSWRDFSSCVVEMTKTNKVCHWQRIRRDLLQATWNLWLLQDWVPFVYQKK
jgi:hypothetical protein